MIDASLEVFEALDQPRQLLGRDLVLVGKSGLDVGAAQQLPAALLKAIAARPGRDEFWGHALGLAAEEVQVVGLRGVERLGE